MKIIKFCTTTFFVLTAIAAACLLINVCYLFSFLIPVEWEAERVENANVIILSLSQSIIAGYIFYLISQHIPTYQQRKYSIEQCLARYRQNFIISFAQLYILDKNHSIETLSEYPEIIGYYQKPGPVKRVVKKALSLNCPSCYSSLADRFRNTAFAFQSLKQSINSQILNVQTDIIDKIANDGWERQLLAIAKQLENTTKDFHPITLLKDSFEMNCELLGITKNPQ